MKKLAYSIAILLAACACTKEASVKEPVAPQATKMTFSATFEGNDALTKTSLGEGKTIVWDEGDAISVFDFNAASTPANSRFTLSTGAGSTSATFQGNGMESSKGYFAVYPYQDGIEYICTDSDYPTGIIGFSKKNYSTQYACMGNIPSNVPMVAYSDAPTDGSSVALNFKNVFSYIKFTTDYMCKSVQITSNNSEETISPSYFSVNFDDNGTPIIANYGTGITSSETITLVDKDGGALDPGTYYIAVLPQTLSKGFTMTFTSAKNEKKTVTRKTEKEVNLKRRVILNLGKIDISSDIIAFAGSGSESDPYQISDLYELKYLAEVTNKGEKDYLNPYYIQTADIDCKDEKLTPIGNVTYMFAGKYDGGGHKISNAIYTHFVSDEKDAAGLFGNIYNATIKNLSVENCRPEDYGEYNNTTLIFGLIAAHAYSSDADQCTITNCNASGSVKYNATTSDRGANQVGGIIGASNANMEISYCTNNANFNKLFTRTISEASMGGILGYAGPVKNKPDNSPDSNSRVGIDRCRNNGELLYESEGGSKAIIVGGIVGRAYDATIYNTAVQISNCVNTGYLGEVDFSLDKACIGGIFGMNDSDGSMTMVPWIFNCLNTGTLRHDMSNGYCGGIIGYNYDDDTSISMCVHAGHFAVGDNTISIGTINGSSYGSHHHIFNTDTNTISLVADKDDSSFTDGSSFYIFMSKDLMNKYLTDCYSDKDAAAWKYVGSSNVLDLDF